MKNKVNTEGKVIACALSFLGEWEDGENPELGFHNDNPMVTRITADLLARYFRYRGVIKHFFDALASRNPNPLCRKVIELGICQLMFQTGIKQHHLIDAIVEFVKRRRGKGAGGFSNAVLRNFCRQYPKLLAGDDASEVPDELKKHLGDDFNRLFLGESLYTSWSSQFSESKVDELVEVLSTKAPVTVRSSYENEVEVDENLEALDLPDWAAGTKMYRCIDAPAFFREFVSGENYYVQDPATLSAIGMVEVEGEDRNICDFCAAPGGKSVAIAEKIADSSVLYSCDINPKRIERLEENLSRFSNVIVMCANALNPKFKPETFDSIILDVPCSNTGVIRRKPDVRWRFSAGLVEELSELQFDIVKSVWKTLKKGGSLVYSTCSVEFEENRGVVDRLLKELPGLTLEVERQLLPCEAHDGSNAARLRKDG